MRALFGNTVSAICYSIVRDESQSLSPSDRLAVSPNAVVNFVLEQQRRMPDYLRLGVLLLTVCFCLAGLRYGALFHNLDSAARQRQIAAWRHARVRLPRDFVRLYESLAVFCWYSMLMSQDARAVTSTVVVPEPALVLSERPSPQPSAVIGDTYQPACHQV